MSARHHASTPAAELRRKLSLALLVVAALCAGAVIGRLSAPAGKPPSAPPTTVAGMPAFAGSEDGAQAAAAWLVEHVYDARGQAEAQVRATFGPLTTRPEALDQVVAMSRTDLDGHAVVVGSQTRVAVIGVKVETYQRAAARIAVWSVLVAGMPPAAGPTQRWQLDLVSLERRDGTWRFAATDTLAGPMPPPATNQASNPVGAATDLFGGDGAAYQAVPDGR
jgi:hypothetical protein